MSRIVRDQIVKINAHATILKGLTAKVKRQSSATGSVTVTLLEGRGAYRVGETVQLKPYELEAV